MILFILKGFEGENIFCRFLGGGERDRNFSIFLKSFIKDYEIFVFFSQLSRA